jgi:serine/threonine protein kinase
MDVFSAGAVLWEALTGRALFRRQDDAATVDALLNGPIPRPSRYAPDLPPGLDAVVLKALQRNPSDRYETAADFAEALDALKIDNATPRAVATHVETNFADKLAERRKLIREAPDEDPEPTSMDGDALRSHVRSSPSAAERSSPKNQTPLPGEVAADGSGELLTPQLTVQEIEHRRLRGIMAAVMLLLVGSAVGLLLARQSPAAAPAPKEPASSPAMTTPLPAEPGRQP